MKFSDNDQILDSKSSLLTNLGFTELLLNSISTTFKGKKTTHGV